MQEPFDNIHKVWALKTIIDHATVKCQTLHKDQQYDSIAELMNIVSDAANKISPIRWTDHDGLAHGVVIYIKSIDTL
jgi:hypothetical protein